MIIINRASPCPCGSGKAIEACHLDPIDNQLRIARPKLTPPGQKTGLAHPKCYLRGTFDCSEDISREHYVSKNVLAQIGQSAKLIRVKGVPWVKEGTHKDMSLDSLAANILCRRHNTALSPLDEGAGRFFSVLTKVLVDLNRKTLSRKPRFHLVSGEALELWMLKIACGLYYGIGMKAGLRVENSIAIDDQKIISAFFQGRWEPRAGLYLLAAPGEAKTVDFGVSLAALTDDVRKHFAGARVHTNGIGFDLLFDTEGVTPGEWSGLTRRPTELVFQRNRREHHVILSWPLGTPEASITFSGSPPNDR